jgi:hypothetical protein
MPPTNPLLAIIHDFSCVISEKLRKSPHHESVDVKAFIDGKARRWDSIRMLKSRISKLATDSGVSGSASE